MKKFIQVANNLQLGSETIQESNVKFSISCQVCTKTFTEHDCEKCQIAATHSSVIAALATKEVKEHKDN